jgi:tetratricopeptide (TPR) repeat protein
MSTDIRASDFFVAGGTLHPDAPSYVKRSADDELFNLALAGEFCYVLTPRQMGKSSLMIRTARRLQEHGIRTAIIDLTSIGTNVTVEQWYLSLLSQLKRRLRLPVDPATWWQGRASLGCVQRFTDFLRDVILTQIEEQVVIFIDEIDTTLNLDFRDDFFAAIRAVYNARADDPEFDRLTFVLLGAASPPDLIKDRARTPFNIGQGITLQEFSRTDATVLQSELETLYPGQGEAIFARIYHWTNGHPYLTQKLCLAVAETGDDRWTDARVDDIVERLFLSEEARKETNLQFVQDKILTHSQRRELLSLYRKVIRGEKVGDDGQSPLQNLLKLSGLVKAENGYLHIRNEIYRRAFDLTWVRENTAVDYRRPLAVGIAAGIVVSLALFVYAYVTYRWMQTQCQEHIASFYQANTREEQLASLSGMFQLQSLFGSADCAIEARELFHRLSVEEQVALFDTGYYSVEDLDLMMVPIRELYITLADVDGTGDTDPILEAMINALGHIYDTEETTRLASEINRWLQGRVLARQSQYKDALSEYNRAIELNGENPATRYERAKVLTELLQYRQALSDLDQVVAIAREAPVPTRTPSPSTAVPAASPVPTTPSTSMPRTDTPIVQIPSAGMTATPTSSLVSIETPALTPTPESGPIASEFATFWQIIDAVLNLIYSDPGLVGSLASAPGSEYTNLRELGLAPTPTPTEPPNLGSFAGPSLDTTEILPDGWKHLSTYRMDTNNDGKREWVILYYFDLLERSTSGSPIGAAIYQPDDESPPSLVPHELRPPDGDYLCACACGLNMENVLSGLEGDELVVRDRCNEETTRLTIFHWDSDRKEYISPAHFLGGHIEVSQDQVTIKELLPGRAQLMKVETYYPDDNKTYYRQDDPYTLLECREEELDFVHGEPEDVLSSPYPEKVVLAFYNHYNDDEKAPEYFAESVRAYLGQCDAGGCGCIAPRHEIARVQVTYLQVESDSEAQDPDRAIVGVRINCQRRDGVKEGRKYIRWYLVREGDRWRLDHPE